MQTTKFSQLSKSRRVLIRLCQRVSYGSILNVQVAGGEVSFGDPPNVTVDVRLDGDAAERVELSLTDFALPVESLRLLDQIDRLQEGVIEKIVVQDGLPRRVVWHGLLPEASK
jgi:hypothetical protein